VAPAALLVAAASFGVAAAAAPRGGHAVRPPGATARAAGVAPVGHTVPAVAHAASLVESEVFAPYTPWHQPPMVLPEPLLQNYIQLAEDGISQAEHWRSGHWYCEYLGCANGPYPLLTVWGEVPMFETVDALQIVDPTPSHYALVERFARASEHYWNRYLDGYAPYPNDRGRGVEAWFDDNGWLGLGFLNAYRATHDLRYLADAQRALHFIAANGWDAAGGGGMWWNTDHPYHSGPAIASDSLLGILLYGEDHEAWQLQDVRTWVDWANAEDTNDERQLYLEQPNEPESVNDYVQAPLIYAQYLLCKDGQGESYCVRAGRTAATMAETHVSKSEYSYNYGPEYDAIYLQWMMAYGQATNDPYWLKLAEVNATGAANHATNAEGLWLSSWWGGPIADPETHPGMFRTMAATTSLFAWLAVYTGQAPPSSGARVTSLPPAHRTARAHSRRHRAHPARRHQPRRRSSHRGSSHRASSRSGSRSRGRPAKRRGSG
jgi:Glycosyl hydrolase family 76